MKKWLWFIAGDKDSFKLEHQVFNSTSFFITAFAFIASTSNWVLGLHPLTIWPGFLGGLTSMVIFYLSRIKRVFNVQITISYLILTMLFMSGIYFFNDGSSGTIIYLVVMFLTIMLMIVHPRYQFLVFTLSYGTILTLLLLEYFNPAWVVGYASTLVRIQDYMATIFLSTLFTTITIVVFRTSYIDERERVNRQNTELLLLNRKIDLQKAELEKKAMELEQSILLANERNARIETLMKELHHRVKNNLQVISSLLALQYNRMEDDHARQSLMSSRTRIEAMALIHKSLYQHENVTEVEMENYLRSLVKLVAASYGAEEGLISLDVKLDNKMVDIDSAIPIGLIVNELLSNACKHAFGPDTDPKVWVSFRQDGVSGYILRVADNGRGMGDGNEAENNASFGMKLVHTLVTQLDAEMNIVNNNGTEFIIEMEV
ncbi:sensor histidine kinase [Flavihumibacter stibioxidans]|uniref:histidine kinase n=1 Tax=Flavihumibacter stibioxidans TaxID=1834163 RepID=A0ABR7MEF5_9BACT|nr:sensor histidine kinase [Flavihumibacter stibioxidans]MBC6492953.1 hypothetical protein [Flavihumibacter stibioxidans]